MKARNLPANQKTFVRVQTAQPLRLPSDNKGWKGGGNCSASPPAFSSSRSFSSLAFARRPEICTLRLPKNRWHRNDAHLIWGQQTPSNISAKRLAFMLLRACSSAELGQLLRLNRCPWVFVRVRMMCIYWMNLIMISWRGLFILSARLNYRESWVTGWFFKQPWLRILEFIVCPLGSRERKLNSSWGTCSLICRFRVALLLDCNYCSLLLALPTLRAIGGTDADWETALKLRKHFLIY